MVLNAKTRYRQIKPDVDFHSKLVVDPRFLAAVEVALLQFTEATTGDGDVFASACAFHQVKGAKRFIETFLSLTETSPAIAKLKSHNLEERE